MNLVVFVTMFVLTNFSGHALEKKKNSFTISLNTNVELEKSKLILTKISKDHFEYRDSNLRVSVRFKNEKPISFFTYSNGILIQEKIDLNQDGIFETLVHYLKKPIIKKVYKDLKDGEFYTVQEYENRKNVLTKHHYKYNLKTKKYEKHFSEVISSVEHIHDKCLFSIHPKAFDKVEVFFKLFSDYELEQSNGYFEVADGVIIDKSCFKDKLSSRIVYDKIESINAGLQCLNKLAKTSSKIPPELDSLIIRLNELYSNKENPQKIYCGDHAGDWSGGSLARASTQVGVDLNKRITHPYTNINPNLDLFNTSDLRGTNLQNTLLHESIHNVGYGHDSEHDYAYLCSNCCFSESDTVKTKNMFCKLCKNDYPTRNSSEYINDLLSIGPKVGSTKFIAHFIGKELSNIGWNNSAKENLSNAFISSHPGIFYGLIGAKIEKGIPLTKLELLKYNRYKKKYSPLAISIFKDFAILINAKINDVPLINKDVIGATNRTLDALVEFKKDKELTAEDKEALAKDFSFLRMII